MASRESAIEGRRPSTRSEAVVQKAQGDEEVGDDNEARKAEDSAEAHRESVEYVERHHDLFEHQARGQAHFKPAPPGLDTFAFDLKTDDIYVNSRFFKKRGFSEERTTYATMHEIEHYLEKKKLLQERNGPRIFDRYLKRIGESGAYKVMDNCVADTSENESVNAKTNESFASVEQDLYKQDLFPTTDFTDKPKHIQLPMAILRESRIPGETCKVAPEVRVVIDEIRDMKSSGGMRLMDIISHPETPMSVRLRLQDKHIWPRVEKLLEEDMSDPQYGDNGGGEDGETGDGAVDGHGESKETKSGKPASKGKPGKGKKGGPNKRFKKAYDKADEQMPHAVPVEKQKEALKEWKEGKGDPLDRADQAYADQLGVKKEDLQKYRSLAEEVAKSINPESNQSVVAELRALIERIIANRMKERLAPQYPVEEGEFLVDPAELVSQVKAGNFEPKAWETQEVRAEKGKRFGKVRLRFVFDRSGSMNGTKAFEQQRAAVVGMEALKEMSDRAKEEELGLTKPLVVESEVYSFQKSAEDGVPFKRLSAELSERDRITVVAKLGSTPGPGTTDFIPLEAIATSLTEEDRRLLADGEVKDIIIVCTDGGSDDAARVSRVLERLRTAGVVVVGVGITESGSAALTTYAPTARLAETAERLPFVMGDVLKEHLADL